VRLGDGTELSHERAQAALDDVWRYTGEMFVADDIDVAVQEGFEGPDLDAIRELWLRDVEKTVAEATLRLPEDQWMASGGKQGQHSEHLGFMLGGNDRPQQSTSLRVAGRRARPRDPRPKHPRPRHSPRSHHKR